MYTFTALLTLLPLFVSAVFTPTTPDSTTVVKVGQNLNIAWTADTQGLWSNLEIQLMAGSNFAVSPGWVSLPIKLLVIDVSYGLRGES